MIASLTILGTLGYYSVNAVLPHNRFFARMMLGMTIATGIALYALGGPAID